LGRSSGRQQGARRGVPRSFRRRNHVMALGFWGRQELHRAQPQPPLRETRTVLHHALRGRPQGQGTTREGAVPHLALAPESLDDFRTFNEPFTRGSRGDGGDAMRDNSLPQTRRAFVCSTAATSLAALGTIANRSAGADAPTPERKSKIRIGTRI